MNSLSKFFGTRLAIAFALYSMGACGANLFEVAESEDPASDAVLALEAGKPNEAIEISEKALEDDPTNYQLISILASAYAQKAGFSPLDFALELATQKSTSSDSGGGITSTFSALPEANASNLAAIGKSVECLESIPVADRQAADTFKLSMFYTAKMGMLAKQFSDTVGGELTAENLQNLTPDQALEILASLGGAAAAVAAMDSSGDANSAKAVSQINSIQAKIDEQPGENETERLRNYLASQQSSSTESTE